MAWMKRWGGGLGALAVILAAAQRFVPAIWGWVMLGASVVLVILLLAFDNPFKAKGGSSNYRPRP